jgi:transposase
VLNFGRPRAIWLCVATVDGRKGFLGLYGIVKEELGHDPQSGSVFAFINRRRNRLKLLFTDGSGLCLFIKRLERGGFRWPELQEGQKTVEISAGQLALLLSGLEPVVRARPRWWRGMLPAVSKDTIRQ